VPVADTPPVGRENDTGGRIREHFAVKLTHKDGTGLPPQGRTVRAGVALPPGGARLLFHAIVAEVSSVTAEVSPSILLLLL